MIIYQIYPRSYQDSNGDGIGDIPGIIQRLPHIASLGGIEYVWISPFFVSPMKDFGYDVADFRNVDPIFGTNEDFDNLLKESDRLGLKVMIDVVLCHTSNEHPWFVESAQERENPKSDWYVWKDPKPDGTPPNNWLSFFGGSAWEWNSRRQQYYLRHFLVNQPALNWYNQEVIDEMHDVFRFWLEKGVKGFRLDAVVMAHHDPLLRDNPADPTALARRLTDSFLYQEKIYDNGQPEAVPAMAAIRNLVNQYEGTLLLGEISDRKAAHRYTGPTLLHSTYFFDFLDLKDFDPLRVKKIIGECYADFPEANFFWALSNHDFARHITRLNPLGKYEQEFAIMTSALFLTLPGGYTLYQGEEFGFPAARLTYDQLVDPFDRFIWPHGQKRDTARTPIPWEAHVSNGGFSVSNKTWLPVDSTQQAMAPDQQEKNPDSILNFFRKTIIWRNTIWSGKNSITLEPDSPTWLLAFWLTGPLLNEPLLCLFNLSGTEQKVLLSSVVKSSGLTPRGPAHGSLEDKGEFSFKPFGFIVGHVFS
jgi:alpha-glucosidase